MTETAEHTLRVGSDSKMSLTVSEVREWSKHKSDRSISKKHRSQTGKAPKGHGLNNLTKQITYCFAL